MTIDKVEQIQIIQDAKFSRNVVSWVKNLLPASRETQGGASRVLHKNTFKTLKLTLSGEDAAATCAAAPDRAVFSFAAISYLTGTST